MRHHYVPQFLLREWAGTTHDKKVETFRLDLPRVPSSRRSPKHVAYEENLYALTLPDVAGMEQQAVENHVLRHIDTLAAAVLRSLMSTGLTGLTWVDRCDWVRFLEEYDAIAEFGDPPTLVEWTLENYPGLVENFGLSFLNELIDNPKIGGKIARMKWWLWSFVQERHDLLLADHPCVFTTGMNDPNLVIALPISPSKAFMATASERVANVLRKQRPRHLLMSLNESSLVQARARIYARDASAHRFIRNRLVMRRPAI